MEGIINLHHDIIMLMLFVFYFVLWLILRTIREYSIDDDPQARPYRLAGIVNRESGLTETVHGTVLEVFWTIMPSLVLIVIAIPSFALLYSVDEVIDPALTIKCVGHQWYWSYELSDFDDESGTCEFDSYMIPEEDLVFGELRLLEVDNRVVIPVHTHIRVIITAVDVLHSWAVPSLGLKMDACPGRLNQTALYANRTGAFFGQCSEICGVNHGFMPIVVESVSLDQYVAWHQSKF